MGRKGITCTCIRLLNREHPTPLPKHQHLQVDAVLQSALHRHGRIDGVACCVGDVTAQSLLACRVSDLEASLRVNLVTQFNVLKSAVKVSECAGFFVCLGEEEGGGCACRFVMQSK